MRHLQIPENGDIVIRPGSGEIGKGWDEYLLLSTNDGKWLLTSKYKGLYFSLCCDEEHIKREYQEKTLICVRNIFHL